MLRWMAVDLLLNWFWKGIPDVRVMLACETYPDLRDRHITKIKTEFPPWMGKLANTQDDGLCFRLNANLGGGVIALRNLDDPSKFQSAEFAAILVDELTKNSKEVFDILRGSLRCPGIEHTVFLAATNPGGIGHGWVKRLWIDRNFPSELRPRADEFKFIQSLPKDNPHLPKSYWDELNSLPENLREAWVLGNWDVFSGMAFPNFDERRHVIEPFDIPDYWVKTRGVDWGYTSPFCCLWSAKNPDNGKIYVYRECYRDNMTDLQQANWIKELTSPEERIDITFADPSMWISRTTNIMVTSSADVYWSQGVYLTRGDNNRINGKRKLDRLLANQGDGEPGIFFFDTCKNLIRTLPLLTYAANESEDIDPRSEDHAYDALRYNLTYVREETARKAKTLVNNPYLAIRGI